MTEQELSRLLRGAIVQTVRVGGAVFLGLLAYITGVLWLVVEVISAPWWVAATVLILSYIFGIVGVGAVLIFKIATQPRGSV